MTSRIILIGKNSELSPFAFQRWGAARAVVSHPPDLARAGFYSGNQPGCAADAIGHDGSRYDGGLASDQSSVFRDEKDEERHVDHSFRQTSPKDGARPSEAGAVDWRELAVWSALFVGVLIWLLV